MINSIKKAVFFGAHTDDEMICAGTLHRLARSGCQVHVVTFGPAATKDDRRGTIESSRVVAVEWMLSTRIIGVDGGNAHFLGQYVDGYVPSATMAGRGEEMCQDIYDFCESEKPDLAIVLSPRDENTAHAVLGVQCERVMRGRVPNVWRCLFPWNYGQGDRPNLYVSLSPEDLEAKRRVIECYQSQKFRYNYLDMLMSQAIADGLSVKVDAAEKFEIVRSVVL